MEGTYGFPLWNIEAISQILPAKEVCVSITSEFKSVKVNPTGNIVFPNDYSEIFLKFKYIWETSKSRIRYLPWISNILLGNWRLPFVIHDKEFSLYTLGK